ncbi:MAG: sigma factor [Syntrophomonadaceae bacterium]|jgi:RNA polymerase sigma factor
MSSSKQILSESRIIEAWRKYQAGDKGVIEEIYPDLLTFCLRVASKTCNRYITVQDDEASIAQISIVEAFEKYNPERGSFYSFLGTVIRNRIIDYKRKESRSNNIPLSNLEGNEGSFPDIVDDDFFTTIIDDLARQQEIEKFKKVLSDFQISFEDLVAVSPRQPRTREKSKRIACLINEEDELREYLLEKKMLPAKILRERFKIDHKVLDRYRKYIIAGVIILNYEFAYLQPFIFPEAQRRIIK